MLRSLAPDIEVRSRGVHDWNLGKGAHPAVARLAAARGHDLSDHVAAQVTAADLAWADDILVMDEENRRQLVRCFPADLVGRVRLLDPEGIPDPWLTDTDAAYAASLDQIEQAARTYLAGLGPRPMLP